MDTFFSSDPGLGSRVANHIDFPDYSVEELVEIAHRMLEKLDYDFTPDAERASAEYLDLRMKRPQFSNASSVRNALDRARIRQAARLFEVGGIVTPEDLKAIEADDILNSRVFDLQAP